MKNPAFEEEKEVRIVYNTGIYEEIEDKEFLSYTSEAIPIGRNEEFLGQIESLGLTSSFAKALAGDEDEWIDFWLEYDKTLTRLEEDFNSTNALFC